MQECNKKIILKALAKTVKRLHNGKSIYNHSLEYGLTYSVLYKIERGEKNPQLTTLFELANSFEISISEFLKEIEKDLPDNFTISDD